MVSLLGELLPTLPAALYVHASPPLLDVFRERYAVEAAEPHSSCARPHRPPRPSAAAVELLGENDLLELDELYRRRIRRHGSRRGCSQRGGTSGSGMTAPRLRRRRPRPFADLGRGGPRQRRHAAGASRPRAGVCGLRRPLPAVARGRDRDDRAQGEGGQRRRDRGLLAARIRGGCVVLGGEPLGILPCG